MRTVSLAVLAVMIVTSQASFQSGIKYQFYTKFPRQGSLFAPEKLNRLESSSVGRAIIHLAELASETKGSFDYSLLWDAIDELEADLQSSKNDENDLFESDREQYVADTQFYSNQITQFENEVAQLNVDVEDLTATRTSFEQSLQRKNDELAETKALMYVSP